MNAVRLAALAAAACVVAMPEQAETVNLAADLSARNEVPPNMSSASGRAEMRLDTVSGNLSWTINYTGLSAPLSAAHFHEPAAAQANAGASLPLSGAATLSPTQGADVLAGRWYVNLHTPNNPGGEIRGQVVRR